MSNKLTLLITSEQSADDKKTAAFPRRRARRLGRRRVQGRMNFWDLGMVSTGPEFNEWEMLNFQPSVPPFGTSSSTFNTTWHEELLDKIFEVDVENWRTHYKKIVPEMEYPLEINAQDISGFSQRSYMLDGSDPEFTSAGLKVSSDFFDSNRLLGVNLQAIGNVSAFRTQFLEKGASSVTSGVKVTDVYDPSASEVAFDPTKSCDVFLVPALPYALCRFEHAEAGGTPYHAQQLNEFFYLLDRNIILDTILNPLPGATTFVHFRNTSGTPTEGSQTEYDNFLAVADYYQGFANSRARYSTVLPINYTSSDDGTSFGAVLPGGYSYTPPPPNTEGTVFMACALDGNTGNPNIGGSSSNQILLRAVIHQGGQYYYIWNWSNVP